MNKWETQKEEWEKRREAIFRWREKGKSFRWLARKFGVTDTRIYQILKEYAKTS